jgi:hypothetical protein
MLTTPFDKMDAYKFGIIDIKGKKIRDPKTPKEEDAYDMLWRLVIRLKRVINLVPVENKNFLSYAAAYALIRECQELDEEPSDLDIRYAETLLTIQENKYYNREIDNLDFQSLFEDGMVAGAATPTGSGNVINNPIANTQQNIKDTITGVGKKAKIRYFRRSAKPSLISVHKGEGS